jgi:ATPase-IB1_Cu: copper-translocating P-type ATPase
LFGGVEAVPYALYSVISIFIVACPCALGLVTPVALMRGIGKAAKMHIWIKNSLALERLDKTNVVVFDKTGTLTEGHPTVTAWLWAQYQEEYFKRGIVGCRNEFVQFTGNGYHCLLERRTGNACPVGWL